MRIPLSKITACAGAILLIILGCRVAWHASHTQVGWDMLRTGWVQTLADVFGIERHRLAAEEPEIQAKFWIRETARLDRSKPTAAQLAGAAWMLDSPQTDFQQRNLRANPRVPDLPGLPLGTRLELDWAAVKGRPQPV